MTEQNADPPECERNLHGERHCFHWLTRPPTLYWEEPAECCWCGTVHYFGYESVVKGQVPVSPSSGAVHGPYQSELKQ